MANLMNSFSALMCAKHAMTRILGIVQATIQANMKVVDVILENAFQSIVSRELVDSYSKPVVQPNWKGLLDGIQTNFNEEHFKLTQQLNNKLAMLLKERVVFATLKHFVDTTEQITNQIQQFFAFEFATAPFYELATTRNHQQPPTMTTTTTTTAAVASSPQQAEQPKTTQAVVVSVEKPIIVTEKTVRQSPDPWTPEEDYQIIRLIASRGLVRPEKIKLDDVPGFATREDMMNLSTSLGRGGYAVKNRISDLREKKKTYNIILKDAGKTAEQLFSSSESTHTTSDNTTIGQKRGADQQEELINTEGETENETESTKVRV